MTEEITLLLPPQDLAARRHFFEEVANGGNRFHRSTPATPLAVHRSTASASDVASLAVGVVMEKCLSENSLLSAQERQAAAASKSDGNISSSALDGNDEVICPSLPEDKSGKVTAGKSCYTRTKQQENNSCGGEEESKMTGVTGEQGAQDGLILPKKLQNPCVESTDRQRLHRELMLNQKLGKNVLNQKSELQKAMEKYKDNQFRKELEQQRQENMTPLERVIEQRAKRLEILERDNTLNEKEISPKEPEFLQIHAKLRARMDAK